MLHVFRSGARAIATLSSVLCLAAHAEEGNIATDRPDFVESSAVVGKGRFQIETGFTRERMDEDGTRVRATSTPTLLRFGISDSWELRAETDGHSRVTVDDASANLHQRLTGMNDVSFGAKWHMKDEDGSGGSSVAWLLHADVDTGSRELRGNGVRPSLRVVAEWELPHDVSLGVMPGVVFEKNDDGRRYTAGIAALTLGKGWTDRLRTFVELAGQELTSERNGGSQVTYDAGATYLITEDVQVDMSLSWGANRHTPDFQWGAGLSVRF